MKTLKDIRKELQIPSSIQDHADRVLKDELWQAEYDSDEVIQSLKDENLGLMDKCDDLNDIIKDLHSEIDSLNEENRALAESASQRGI